jgi:hypothetical protein
VAVIVLGLLLLLAMAAVLFAVLAVMNGIASVL